MKQCYYAPAYGRLAINSAAVHLSVCLSHAAIQEILKIASLFEKEFH